ncbi:YaiI/YqxD family protein [Desulfotomaculum sp. 1211_IL3151]|uniref:YaiI/YqxD family protein n=1 Tax=Desulfotomaculum sp. 1211_IL3151 TaxID=3084055 RepID=UPI002FD93112
MKVIIDADACPKGVLSIAQNTCLEYGLELWTVANFNHNIRSEHHITVGNSSQEADIEIMNITKSGDIVVTQDWGLAAMVLAKGAGAISPTGRIFQAATIDFLLEEREIKAKHRRTGGRTKGPQKRKLLDDLQFRRELVRLIDEMS